MDQHCKEETAQLLRRFHLPAYADIPDVGLFLEQVVQYINTCFSPLPHSGITASMISNYVKKGVITRPVRKQYSREQIARLFFITVAKTVVTLEDLPAIFRVQQNSYPPDVAYDYFRRELENVLYYVFGLKETLDTIGVAYRGKGHAAQYHHRRCLSAVSGRLSAGTGQRAVDRPLKPQPLPVRSCRADNFSSPAVAPMGWAVKSERDLGIMGILFTTLTFCHQVSPSGNAGVEQGEQEP